jgi:hypothetical protein
MLGRVALAAAAGAAVGLALAVPAGADTATQVVKLKMGDGFVVTGTHVRCAAQVSKTLLPGDRVIGCAYSDSKGPVAGTYEVALAANGLAVIAKVKRDGSPSVVYRRKPAAASSRTKVYRVKSGAVVFVSDTNIACSVSKSSAGVATSCFPFSVARANALPETFGVGITDRIAYMVRFDSKSKSIPIKVLQQKP